MKKLVIAVLVFAPISAMAQSQQPEAQPITISGPEYVQIMQQLMQRDPIISHLMMLQTQAQTQAQKEAQTQQQKEIDKLHKQNWPEDSAPTEPPK